MYPARRSHFRLAIAASIAAALGSCKSPAEYRQEADRDAYQLVSSRREKIGLPESPFTIEPDPDSLSERLRRGEVDDVGAIDLSKALEIASSNSREYQTQKETLYLSALDLTLERWDFALQKGGSLGAALGGTGSDADLAAGTGEFSLSKLFGSGALLVGDIGLGISRGLLTSEGWNTVSDVGVKFTQPLLAGAGEKIVLEPLTQAERNLVYSVRAFERFRRTFAFDVASRYFRLIQSADQVRNQEENVRNLELLSQRNRALVEATRLSDIEFGQARQGELGSQNDLLDARARHERLIDEFAVFLGLPVGITIELNVGDLLALEQSAPEVEVVEDVATRIALESRLDFLTTLEREEDSVRRVEVSEDALQGILNLRADWRAFSAEGKSLKLDATAWGVGLDYTLPWERLPERNAWRESIVRREAARRASIESEDRIRADLRDDLRQTVTQLEARKIQESAVALAERRIESTRLQLDAGRADTRDLLEAQESLLSAQNSATAARIDYTLARMGLYLDMELLRLDETGIRLIEPGTLEGE